MSVLDKINDLIVRIQSGDEEFIAVFKEDFKKFEEEYDKEAMMVQVKEMVGRMSANSKEMSSMKQSEDNKISLRKITNEKLQVDGESPITEQIATNIDHLPINRMVEIIKEKALNNAKYGMNTAFADFIRMTLRKDKSIHC